MKLLVIPAEYKRFLMDKAMSIDQETGEPDMDMDSYQRELVKMATGMDGTKLQRFLENKGLGVWNALYKEVENVNGNPLGIQGLGTREGIERAKNSEGRGQQQTS